LPLSLSDLISELNDTGPVAQPLKTTLLSNPASTILIFFIYFSSSTGLAGRMVLTHTQNAHAEALAP
jgi:hypothetical protein